MIKQNLSTPPYSSTTGLMYKKASNGERYLLLDVFQVILEIIDSFQPNLRLRTLHSCSLVSREWNHLTLPMLYRDIDIHYKLEQYLFNKSQDSVVDCTTTLEIPSKDRLILSMFSTSKGEKYASFVRNLKIPLAFITRGTEINIFLECYDEIEPNPFRAFQPKDPLLSLFTNLRKIEVLGWEFRGQISAEVRNGLTNVLSNLQHLHTLVIEGCWLYNLPPKLVSLKCRAFNPGYDISLLTAAVEDSSCLQDLELALFCRVRSPEEPFRQSRSIDWTRFIQKKRCPSLKHIRLSILCDPNRQFEPRRLSVLLRFIAQCTSLETLSLDRLNIDFDDLTRICSGLPFLRNLEVSCPLRVLRSHLPGPENSWNNFQNYIGDSSNLVTLDFIYPCITFSRSKADCNDKGSSQTNHQNALETLAMWSENWFNQRIQRLALSKYWSRGILVF